MKCSLTCSHPIVRVSKNTRKDPANVLVLLEEH